MISLDIFQTYIILIHENSTVVYYNCVEFYLFRTLVCYEKQGQMNDRTDRVILIYSQNFVCLGLINSSSLARICSLPSAIS